MDTLYKELKAKLRSLEKERATLLDERNKLQERLSDIDGAIRGIENLFKLEGITNSEVQQKRESKKPLAEFIKEVMSDRKPHSVDDLIKLVKSMGYDFEEKSPYRSINFTLMGLQRGGEYTRTPNGWLYIGHLAEWNKL